MITIGRISRSQSPEYAYLEQASPLVDGKGTLFRTIGRGTAQLTSTPLPQANAYAMVVRRALAAGIATKVGNHSFWATGSPPPQEWRYAGEGGRHGQSYQHAHDATL